MANSIFFITKKRPLPFAIAQFGEMETQERSFLNTTASAASKQGKLLFAWRLKTF